MSTEVLSIVVDRNVCNTRWICHYDRADFRVILSKKMLLLFRSYEYSSSCNPTLEFIVFREKTRPRKLSVLSRNKTKLSDKISMKLIWTKSVQMISDSIHHLRLTFLMHWEKIQITLVCTISTSSFGWIHRLIEDFILPFDEKNKQPWVCEIKAEKIMNKVCLV